MSELRCADRASLLDCGDRVGDGIFVVDGGRVGDGRGKLATSSGRLDAWFHRFHARTELGLDPLARVSFGARLDVVLVCSNRNGRVSNPAGRLLVYVINRTCGSDILE